MLLMVVPGTCDVLRAALDKLGFVEKEKENRLEVGRVQIELLI